MDYGEVAVLAGVLGAVVAGGMLLNRTLGGEGNEEDAGEGAD